MIQKKLTIDYLEYSSVEEMSEKDQQLVAASIEAQKGSYSPYSHFQVGAALRLEDGTIVQGANQENAAYPSGLCAERTALFAAGATHGAVPPEAIAIVASDHGQRCADPATPCGACRQVMAQYQNKFGKPLATILVGTRRIYKFHRVDDLLPFIFDSIDA